MILGLIRCSLVLLLFLANCCLHWRIVKMANVCTKTESNYADLLARPTKDEYWAKHVHVRCNKHSLRMATCHKQSRTTTHTRTHATHTYLRVYMYISYAQQGGRTKASLSFYGTAATCQQTARKSELYTQFPTHAHTRTLGQYLKSAVVTRRRSGNGAEIASRPLRYGIEQ